MSSSQSATYILIPSDDGPGDAPLANTIQADTTASTAATPSKSRHLLRLTDASLFGSIVAIFFLIVEYIVHRITSRYFYSYRPYSLVGLYIFTAAALILAFFNRLLIRRSGVAALIFNFVLDFAFSVALAILIINLLLTIIDSWNYPCWRTSQKSCFAFRVSSLVLLCLGLAGATTVWISHITMFVLRSRELWHLESWKMPWKMSFPRLVSLPTAEVAFEFSIRIGKGSRERYAERERSDVNDRNQIARAENGTRNETDLLVEN